MPLILAGAGLLDLNNIAAGSTIVPFGVIFSRIFISIAANAPLLGLSVGDFVLAAVGLPSWWVRSH